MATLTISIPTYNRSAELTAQLRNLGLACSAGAKFEVEVFDNASTDGTEKVVDAARSYGFPIAYRRHSSNIGYQANVAGIFRAATETVGDGWLWVLSDDDIVQPTRIAELCSYLDASENVGLVVVPFVTYTDTGQIVLHPVLPSVSEIDKLEDAWALVHQTTLISSWIYRVNADFKRLLPQALEQEHNTYVQVFLSSLLLKEHRRFGIFRRPVGFELANLTWRFRIRETFLEDKVASLHLTRLLFGLSSPGPVYYQKKMHRFFLRRCLFWVSAGEVTAVGAVMEALRAEPVGLVDRLIRFALRVLLLLPPAAVSKFLFLLRRRYERACMARNNLHALIG